MGLELRLGRQGELIRTWYGRYTENERRISIALCDIEGIPPASLSIRDAGDPAFERSREQAERMFAEHQKEAAVKGRADYLTERLIKAKTGKVVEYRKTADLASLWRAIDRDGGTPTEQYLKWCDSVFRRFAESAKCEFLYQINKEHVKVFLDGMRATRTHKTVKDMTILLRVAFNRLLPVGMTNPFVESIHRKKAKGAIQGGAVARIPLTLEQLDRLYEIARPDPLLYGLTVCAVCTGLRIGDVCCLTWKSVDLRGGWVRVATSKTGAMIEVPMFDKLREVFEAALSEREPDAVYVWPDAVCMYKTNRNGIFYRGKALFARAFADMTETEREGTATASERVDLKKVLARVCKAVQGHFDGVKCDRILDTLKRVADGQSYRQIEADTGRQRGQTSEDLHEAEKITGLTFRAGATIKSGITIKELIDKTRQTREIGCHAASLWGWHNLRGTFVTLALGAGVPFETVAKCTGHTTAKTVRDHYYNPTREHTRQAMALAGKLTGRKAPLALPEADPVATMAAQLRGMTKADRTRLTKLLKGGKE